MGNLTLAYFMWGYQHYFQGSANRSAEELVNEILPGADPLLFLVGLLDEERTDRLPVCVEPDHGPIQPGAFAEIESVAQAIREADERSEMLYSHPVAAERVYRRLAEETFARAIEQCCQNADGQQGFHFFASEPTRVDSYLVFCVLRCRREPFDRQVHLIGNTVDRVPVVKSFIEAVIIEFLAECRIALREPNAGENLCVVKATSDELRRRGGKRFIRSIAWRAFDKDASSLAGLGHVEQLWDAMTSVAAMKYEGGDAGGHFVVCQDSNSAIAFTIRLKSAVGLREERRIRKLLELSRGELALILTDAGVAGLGRIDDTDTNPASLFHIDVLAHHVWRLRFAKTVLCEFRYGLPGIPRPRLNFEDFSELCARVLPTDARVAALWKIIDACTAQRHGTIVVISTDAVTEADRLAKQSTTMEPKLLSESDVHSLSSIDGAMLVDHQAACHSIGVILDGTATNSGDPGRGARFNSAVRYLESRKAPCLICIVSEDGDVTLLPRLRPRVRRSTVENSVVALVSYLSEPTFKPRQFAEIKQKVSQFRFYLDQDQCVRVNETIEAVARREAEDVTTVRITQVPFTPDPAMHESYWLPE